MPSRTPIFLRHHVAAQLEGRTLDWVLRRVLFVSGTEMKRLKGSNSILLNASPAHVGACVRGGDTITLLLENDSSYSQNILPVYENINVLYEDDHILIANKPAGMPVHPSRGHSCDSLANRIAGHYALSGGPGVVRLVNRLDANTSGVMLVARTAYAQELLRRAPIERGYLAVAHGVTPPAGLIDAPIQKQDGPSILRVVNGCGRPAQTCYRRLATGQDSSLLYIRPQTGRTHQIRAHMAHIGHPLYGDFLYGREEPGFIARHALHSAHISFIHPLARRRMCVGTPLPGDIAALLGILKITVEKQSLFCYDNVTLPGGIL